jgi:hypothetical protein
MSVREFRCRMCGCQFKLEVMDEDDSRERRINASRVRCPRPECRSAEISEVRIVERLRRAS